MATYLRFRFGDGLGSLTLVLFNGNPMPFREQLPRLISSRSLAIWENVVAKLKGPGREKAVPTTTKLRKSDSV